MNKRVTDILGYVSWIGFIIAMCAGTREESKFHLNQALVWNIAYTGLGILSTIFSSLTRISGFFSIFSILCSLATIAVTVFAVIAFVGACRGQDKEMILLGQIHILK